MDTVDPAAIIGSTLVDSTGHHAVVLTSLIGSGSFAHVYLAEEVPSLGQQPERRAVKRLFKEGLDERQLILQRQEAEVMKSIEPHQNIIRLLATVEDDECLYLIMEYCELDLYEAITQQGGFPDDVVKEVFGQIADAVIHCHASGFYHRDLKPENCLISADYKVKLADFGLATADPWSSEMGCGSVRYMAPECFDPLHNAPEPADNFAPPPSDALGYSPPANDVWALGVILINLLFGKNPWFEAHKSDAIFSAYCSSNPNILRQQFNLSPQFDAVLRRAFELDPLRRCSVADLKHMVESMTSFVGTPPLSPASKPPYFSYSNDSILCGTGLVLPQGFPVTLPVDMKSFGVSEDRHFERLAPTFPSSVTNGLDSSLSSKFEFAGQGAILPEAQDALHESIAASTGNGLQKQMSIALAEKLLSSDKQPIGETDLLLGMDDAQDSASDAMAEAVTNESLQRTTALRQYRQSFASSELADVDIGVEPLTESGTEAENLMLQSTREHFEVDHSLIIAGPSVSEVAGDISEDSGLTSTALSISSSNPVPPVDTPSSRSRDSGFESAAGTPSRTNTAAAGVSHSLPATSPRSLMKSGIDVLIESAPSPVVESADRSVRAGPSSKQIMNVDEVNGLTNAVGVLDAIETLRLAELPSSEPIPQSLLGMIGRLESEKCPPDNVSFELPSATRRILRTSKIFKIGKSRTPQPPETNDLQDSNTRVRPGAKTGRVSPRGWFSVAMIRESPGRPADHNSESRPTGVIGLLGLRRRKTSTDMTSPDASPSAVDRSFVRRSSWRTPSPLRTHERRTPRGRRESESSTDVAVEGQTDLDSPRSNAIDRESEHRLRSPFSFGSIKRAWQTIRIRSGQPQSSASTNSGFERDLPPRPASANDIHSPYQQTTGRTPRRPGWRRPGGKSLLGGELFSPSQCATPSPLTSRGAELGGTPLFVESLSTSNDGANDELIVCPPVPPKDYVISKPSIPAPILKHSHRSLSAPPHV